MKSKYKNYIFVVVIMIFYYIIAHTSILALDDFRWATTKGLEKFNNNFENYNGRYFGNYTILLITRSYTAKIIISVIINTGIVILINKILKKEISLAVIMFLILTMPFNIYRETYGFLSGFANYNTSLFFVLSVIYLIKKTHKNNLDLFLLFISGFSVQLFLENISAVNIILTFLFFIYSLFKNEYLKSAFTLLVSNLLGTIVMFSNSAYITNESNRGLSNINLVGIPQNFLTAWSELFFKNNLVLIIALSIGIHLISKKNNYLKYALIPISFYFIVRSQVGVHWYNLSTKILYIEGTLLIIFIVIILYSVYNSDVLTKDMKNNFYLFFVLAGIYSGPLLTIMMNGKPFVFPRNVLATYILLCVSILYLYLPLVESGRFKKKNLAQYLTLVTASLMLAMAYFVSVNYVYNNNRMNIAKKEIVAGATEVKLRKLPFEKLYYSWNISGATNFAPQFKEYYNIPENIQIIEVPLRNKYTENE